MVNFWFIDHKNFTKVRSKRIGASDIPALIPNPEKPNESLSGYGRTPVTVWEEKTGKKERDSYGLPAEMGHFLESKALELFLRERFDYDIGKKFLRKKVTYELNPKDLNPADFQMKPHFHNIQYYTENEIVHPDYIYKGLTKKFNVEAKSANYWNARRPEGSIVKGYDLDLNTWQGIPLKHYMQIQFQMYLLDVNLTYLSLIWNTSQHQVWEIKANKKHQEHIKEIVDNMIWHIKNDKPPKELAMNQNDVKILYPELKNDFYMISGEDRDSAVEICREYKKSLIQEKKWKEKKQECLDSMAVILQDNKELRDEFGIIASWTERKGYEKVIGLGEIKKIDKENKNKKLYRLLKKYNLLNNVDPSRSVKIKYKGDD